MAEKLRAKMQVGFEHTCKVLRSKLHKVDKTSDLSIKFSGNLFRGSNIIKEDYEIVSDKIISLVPKCLSLKVVMGVPILMIKLTTWAMMGKILNFSMIQVPHL